MKGLQVKLRRPQVKSYWINLTVALLFCQLYWNASLEPSNYIWWSAYFINITTCLSGWMCKTKCVDKTIFISYYLHFRYHRCSFNNSNGREKITTTIKWQKSPTTGWKEETWSNGKTTHFPDRSVMCTKVSLNEAKMCATAKTSSPSLAWNSNVQKI